MVSAYNAKANESKSWREPRGPFSCPLANMRGHCHHHHLTQSIAKSGEQEGGGGGSLNAWESWQGRGALAYTVRWPLALAEMLTMSWSSPFCHRHSKGDGRTRVVFDS